MFSCDLVNIFNIFPLTNYQESQLTYNASESDKDIHVIRKNLEVESGANL